MFNQKIISWHECKYLKLKVTFHTIVVTALEPQTYYIQTISVKSTRGLV